MCQKHHSEGSGEYRRTLYLDGGVAIDVVVAYSVAEHDPQYMLDRVKATALYVGATKVALVAVPWLAGLVAEYAEQHYPGHLLDWARYDWARKEIADGE